jgi:sugar/nucleoside kinase (ribokinase family)
VPVVLTVVGDLVEDVVVWTDGLAVGTDNPATVHRCRGGSAANVAAAAARLGSRARFVGRVGDHPLGDLLVAQLRVVGAGVEVGGEREGRTGSVVVLVTPDGERTMLNDRGAAVDLARPYADWLDDVAVVHLPAYSLFPSGGALARTTWLLRQWSVDRGIPWTLDVSSTTLIDPVGASRFVEAIAGYAPDVLFANADEARALGLDGDEPTVPAGVGVVVIKDGPRPARVVTRGSGAAEVALPPLDCVVTDTTGAGDAFAAGFLVARLAGADAVEATRAGHAAAAHVVSGPGADWWS